MGVVRSPSVSTQGPPQDNDTYRWVTIKGKANIKCLRKVLGHHELPELECTLAKIFKVSET